MNLIGNSIKFSTNGGAIKVISKLIKSEDDLTIKDSQFSEAILKSNSTTFLEV